MTIPKILPVLLVLLCCAGLAVETRAQSVTGYTQIDYYPESDTLDAYSETDLDEYLVGDYDAYVSLTVRDQNGSILSSASAEDNTGGNGYITLETLVYGTTPGSTYTARGFHKAIADLWDYQPYYPYQSFYYDDYNFTYFEGQGIYAPWYYYFLSPGFQNIHRNTAPISVGSTYDSDSVSTPAGPPDHLLLGNDLIGSTGCSGVRRQIDYVVVDSNKHIKRNISVVEDPGGAKTDSCSNLNVVFSTSCFQISAIFEDDLKTGCPGSGSCGFDVPTDKWKWCNGTTPPTLATLNYSVHYNQINVDGRPTKYPDKTEFFPDGSVHIPQ